MAYFQTKNPNLNEFGGIAMEGFGIFNGHLVYFKAILMLSWYIFPPLFWYAVPRKIWQPWRKLKTGSQFF
jgi:hypothetical protein